MKNLKTYEEFLNEDRNENLNEGYNERKRQKFFDSLLKPKGNAWVGIDVTKEFFEMLEEEMTSEELKEAKEIIRHLKVKQEESPRKDGDPVKYFIISTKTKDKQWATRLQVKLKHMLGKWSKVKQSILGGYIQTWFDRPDFW